jgi:hypothetical protein
MLAAVENLCAGSCIRCRCNRKRISRFGIIRGTIRSKLRRAADALAAGGASLVVKPNPKSKYEMSQALYELCAGHPAIVPMSHKVKMHELLPRAGAVLSVTGTVILESAFTRIPVAVLGTHELSRVPGVRSVTAPEQAV